MSVFVCLSVCLPVVFNNFFRSTGAKVTIANSAQRTLRLGCSGGTFNISAVRGEMIHTVNSPCLLKAPQLCHSTKPFDGR